MGKQDSPLVSVIVPIYNVEQYLEECFESIKNQSYENIEIILVDDGATDSSGKIADRLAKNHKKTQVIHKKNGGLSDARNAGMKIAKGEYITFVDSDDMISVDFIDTLLNLAVSTGADIAQGNNSRKIEGLSKGSKQTATLTGNDAFVALMKYKTISPTAWGKLYKASLFRDNAIEFPVGRIHEDTAVLYKLIYLAANVSCINTVLYFYRMNDNSIMTASYTERHYSSVVKYHEELDEFIAENNIAVDMKVIYKHKALRLLSVLNKLALANERTGTYQTFLRDYKSLSVEAGALVCIAGILPARFPSIFVAAKKIAPAMRKALGKS